MLLFSLVHSSLLHIHIRLLDIERLLHGLRGLSLLNIDGFLSGLGGLGLLGIIRLHCGLGGLQVKTEEGKELLEARYLNDSPDDGGLLDLLGLLRPILLDGVEADGVSGGVDHPDPGPHAAGLFRPDLVQGAIHHIETGVHYLEGHLGQGKAGEVLCPPSRHRGDEGADGALKIKKI